MQNSVNMCASAVLPVINLSLSGQIWSVFVCIYRIFAHIPRIRI